MDRVAGTVRAELNRLDARVGVCSLASGADLLFAEAVLARGGQVHVILPIAIEEFLNESVRPAAGPSWEARFDAVRAKAATFEVYGDAYMPGSGTPFHVATLLIDGHAQLLAEQEYLHTESLAVWDGRPGDGFGGTASFVGHSVGVGRRVTCVNPRDGRVFQPGADAIRAAGAHSWMTLKCGTAKFQHRLVSVLFADAQGFSRLKETAFPVFIEQVLGAIVRAKDDLDFAPLAINTWGDGLYVVTETPRQAAQFALRLLEESDRIDYRHLDLPAHVRFRVGLHAGPAFVGYEPVIGRINASGADVSLAARIEPIVEPGEAWASRSFVALAAATGRAGLAFDNLGRRSLAKDAGNMTLYRARRG